MQTKQVSLFNALEDYQEIVFDLSRHLNENQEFRV